MHPLELSAASEIPLDGLAWAVILSFILAPLLRSQTPRVSRAIGGTAWVAFGVFWLTQFSDYAFHQKSFIEAALILFGIPACLYIAFLITTQDERAEVTYNLMPAIAIMGVVYLGAGTLPAARKYLIELVTQQAVWGIELLGYDPYVKAGPNYGYQSAIWFDQPSIGPLRTHIEFACTGLGSIAIITGLLSIARESLPRRAVGIAASSVLIYGLNWVRNVFIAVAFGDQWFQVAVPTMLAISGFEHPELVSFFIADKIIAQSLSVIVLVALTLTLLRVYPSLSTVLAETVELVPHPRAHKFADRLRMIANGPD